ncbi:hypothetical protein DL764_002082 [Monosporascus ibericus]|uniref:Uncharacterized protein n=1 Tax=Monosporascus ibericus TaxID=155417 RepID=A0A4V1XC08_9PEZI|nr:hypothetical protein DL764_002082 [Monosporascus ibericus]
MPAQVFSRSPGAYRHRRSPSWRPGGVRPSPRATSCGCGATCITGDAKTADAFVIARSLRRSQTSVIDDKRAAADRQPGTPLLLGRQTVRAIVRPGALERRPFLIERTFDMDELRATIPDPPVRSEGEVTSGPTICSGSSQGQVGASAPYHHQQPANSSRRRPSSVKSGALLSNCSGHLDPESLMRDAKAVPIHLKYARAYLPVLAALLASGHVREGDVVYLPLPHPQAWPQTARRDVSSPAGFSQRGLR